MTDVKIDVEDEAVATVKQDDAVDGRLVEQLTEGAREQGVALTGESGLLGQLTKMVLESALEARSRTTSVTTNMNVPRPSRMRGTGRG